LENFAQCILIIASEPAASQLDPNAIPGKLVGFSLHRHMYRICVNMQTEKII
jgi:hypothetical protein